MNQDILEQWIEALESEEYLQGYESLINGNDEFCCLGVLCNLAAIEGLGEWVLTNEINEAPEGRLDDSGNDNQIWAFQAGGQTEASVLPETIMKWAGISTQDGVFFFEDEMLETLSRDRFKSLAELNDLRVSFKEIAQILRRHGARLRAEEQPEGCDESEVSSGKKKTKPKPKENEERLEEDSLEDAEYLDESDQHECKHGCYIEELAEEERHRIRNAPVPVRILLKRFRQQMEDAGFNVEIKMESKR